MATSFVVRSLVVALTVFAYGSNGGFRLLNLCFVRMNLLCIAAPLEVESIDSRVSYDYLCVNDASLGNIAEGGQVEEVLCSKRIGIIRSVSLSIPYYLVPTVWNLVHTLQDYWFPRGPDVVAFLHDNGGGGKSFIVVSFLFTLQARSKFATSISVSLWRVPQRD